MTEQLTLIFTLRREKGVCCESTLNSRLFSSKSLRFTHFRKNASATPLESHTFKTKDLKPFRFTHLQKSGGGTPCLPPDACVASSAPCTSFASSISFPCVQHPTSNFQPPLLDAKLGHQQRRLEV